MSNSSPLVTVWVGVRPDRSLGHRPGLDMSLDTDQSLDGSPRRSQVGVWVQIRFQVEVCVEVEVKVKLKVRVRLLSGSDTESDLVSDPDPDSDPNARCFFCNS